MVCGGMGSARGLKGVVFVPCVLLAALLGLSVPWPDEVEAGSAPAAAAPAPMCLGKPATIVGQGTVRGTAHADVIVAGPGPDRIEGGGGNDRICAGTGDDVIAGGGGSDRIEAGPGVDTVDGGNGSDLVLGGPGADTLRGRRGNDRLFGQAGARDFVEGGLGDDLVSGGAGGLDQVIGSIGADRIYGGPGDGDVLRGDRGLDVLDGGPGAHDTASFALSGAPMIALSGSPGVEGGATVDLGAGTAEASGERETLTGIEDVIGTPFPDRITGDGEPNVLYGGGDVDDLVGVGPGDTAFGGDGQDRCRYVAVADSCELPGTEPTLSALAEATRATSREGVWRPVAAFEVDLAGGEGASGVSGVVNHGSLLAEGGPGVTVRVSFAAGAWTITEQPLPIVVGDRCLSVSPETVSCPAAGAPEGLYLYGSRGGDDIWVDPSVPATAGAVIVGDRGTDTITGGRGDDTIDGSGETDVVRGGPGDDALTGGAVLDGQSGSDLLIAQACRGEEIEGGPGVDSVSFARSYYGVKATIGGAAVFARVPRIGTGCWPGSTPTAIADSVESIEGSRSGDVLRGDGGANIILGRGGDDEVRGGGGDDFLVGGNGVDKLFGEGGADRLYARDRTRDLVIDCGSGAAAHVAGRGHVTAGDVAVVDPEDPPARSCAEPGAGPG